MIARAHQKGQANVLNIVAYLEIPRLHPISTWYVIYNLLASGYEDDHRNQSRTNYAHVVRNLLEDNNLVHDFLVLVGIDSVVGVRG